MKEELQRVFGHNLRQFRLARGLTRKELADVTGFTEPYIGVIERGDHNLGFQTAANISRLAGADLFELLVPPPEWDDARAAAEGDDPGRRSRRRLRKRPEPPAPTDDRGG